MFLQLSFQLREKLGVNLRVALWKTQSMLHVPNLARSL